MWAPSSSGQSGNIKAADDDDAKADDDAHDGDNMRPPLTFKTGRSSMRADGDIHP